MDYDKPFHTNIYSDTALNIIKSVFQDMVQGKFFANHREVYAANYCNVEKSPSGEIIISVDKKSSLLRFSKALRNNDIHASEWLAERIKLYTVHYLTNQRVSRSTKPSHLGWKRNNTTIINTLNNTTVQDIYCLYELLKDRKTINKHYSPDFIEKIRGVENDPFKTEMLVQQQAELNRINDEYDKKIDSANINNYYSDAYSKLLNEINKIRKQFRTESDEAIAKLKAERDELIAKIKAEYEAIAAA